MQRELSTFPLPPLWRMKLTSAGFLVVDDLTDVKPSELSKELDISKEDALSILQTVHGDKLKKSTETPGGDSRSNSRSGRSCTALEILNDETSQQHIITFSEQLDDMLGGGVPLTKVTEFCGAPGVGKTQMSMQLCVDVQIPECFGGLAGQAIYIDTEGSFIVQRLQDMAKAAVAHCQHVASVENSHEQLQVLKEFTEETILSHVHYFRCHDHIELIALIHILPDFIQEKGQIKLIVVDSIAFHFRHDFEDYSLRTRLLNGLAQSFIKMATQSKLAVVLTNQMTTRVCVDKSQKSQLIPALGESWAHASTIRVILHWQNRQRFATLYKHPSKQECTVPYQITTSGVRDIANQTPAMSEGEPLLPADVSVVTENPRKRRKPEND